MSTPFKPLKAKIKLGTTEIGIGDINTSSLNFSLDVDEHYGLGDEGKPKLVKGNKHFTGRLNKIYVDKTYAEKVLAGDAMDMVFYPEGTTQGKQTVTVKNAILRVWDYRMDRDAIVAEGVEFIGDDLQFGTVA
jgi:hypothetical protein